MIRQVVALCAALVTATSVVAGVTDDQVAYPHVPLMMWSQRPMFPGKNVYSDAEMDTADVIQTLKSTASRNLNVDPHTVLNHNEIYFPQAEVLCVFLHPSLPSSSINMEQFPFLSKAVTTSISSISLPHTIRSTSFSNDSPFKSISSSSFQHFITSDEAHIYLHDAITNVLVVTLDESKDMNREMEKIAKDLEERTMKKVDFAFTSDFIKPLRMDRRLQDEWTAEVEKVVETTKADEAFDAASSEEEEETDEEVMVCPQGFIVGRKATGEAYCFSHYVRMTPQVLAGLLFGAFFLFLLYIGLTVLNGIQTPTRYPLHAPPQGKEF